MGGEPLEFNVNRPFMFILVKTSESSKNIQIFLGTVYDPTETN